MPLADPAALLTAVLEGSDRVLAGIRQVQAEADAGGGMVLGFEVGTRAAGEPAAPVVTDLVYVQPATTTDAGLVVADPGSGERYRVWRYPDDPALPALAAATHPDGAARLLHRVGHGGGEPQLELVSYRPGRRAVIRVEHATGTTYLKVLRPTQVAAVHDRHTALLGAGLPVPRPLGWSPSGLLLLTGLPGRPALEALERAGGDDRLPRTLRGLLDRLAAVRRDWPARRTPVVAADWYAAQVAAAAPDLARRALALARHVAAATAPAGRDTIHGDLHLGQVLVDPDDPHVVLGLLDVDTVGPGHRGDDVSALVANVVVADLQGPAGTAFAAAAGEVARAWPGLLAPRESLADLPARLCAQLLAHALEPAGRGDARLAAQLVSRAEAAVGGEP